MDIEDAMHNPWWSKMYTRNLIQDPVNQNYSHFNQPGLTRPLTVESNPQYAVIMNRHSDGLDTYRMGAVSPAVVPVMGRVNPPTNLMGGPRVSAVGPNYRPSGGIAGCASRTGDPAGCATVYLNQDNASQPMTMGYSRLG